MSNEIKEEMLQRIKDSDMVLVGIGEDLQVSLKELESIPEFLHKRDELMEEDRHWCAIC